MRRSANRRFLAGGLIIFGLSLNLAPAEYAAHAGERLPEGPALHQLAQVDQILEWSHSAGPVVASKPAREIPRAVIQRVAYHSGGAAAGARQAHFVYELAEAPPESADQPYPRFIYDIAQAGPSTGVREDPRFVFEIASQGGFYDAVSSQTSEVTILLERKVSGGDAEKEEPASDAEAADGAAPSEDGYEELEDPFAEVGDDVPVVDDPFEGYNRFMHNVNEGIYDYFLEPVARGYRFVLPEDVRIIISNLFDNAAAPVKLASSLLQGNMDKSGRVLGRFLINSTVGFGGMFDVAGQEYEIENVNEDMDQALGKNGVPTGPYIVLPFFGPSTARGTVGLGVDSLLSPTFLLGAPFAVGAGVTVGESVNDVSFIIEDKESLEESAIDEYESIRDFYLQYRENLLRD